MGGSALVIYGSVSDNLLQPSPAPRSFMDRLLGRERMHVPTWTGVGRGHRMMDLPAGALKGVAEEYRRYITGRFTAPWTATASILDYLKMDIISVHVRGVESDGSPPLWYVQLTFSGCAGMAEVSSELAVHWADRWYHAEQAAVVERFLRPYGFSPSGRIEPEASGVVFVPFNTAGYALYSATPRPVDSEYVESLFFEIDAATTETLDENEKARVLRQLDADAPPRLPGNSCCCQWCAPQFDVIAFEQLVPFR